MLRLASLLFSIIGTAFAGSSVVVVLVLGFGTVAPIIAAAALGAFLALPVSWMIAKQLWLRG
jgi:Mg2+/Co2+ transporter CorB